MEIVTVCGLTFSDFVIGHMQNIKRADVLVLSFGAAETVDFRKEIKGDGGVFVDLCTLSFDLDCVVLCGADTDVYGIRHKSAIIADKGRLIDVSDMVNVPEGYDEGASYRCYKTSAGNLGVIIDGDIMYPQAAKTTALSGADLIVNIADKAADNRQFLAARANALFNDSPVLLLTKDYALLSDGGGEVKQSGSAAISIFSL